MIIECFGILSPSSFIETKYLPGMWWWMLGHSSNHSSSHPIQGNPINPGLVLPANPSFPSLPLPRWTRRQPGTEGRSWSLKPAPSSTPTTRRPPDLNAKRVSLHRHRHRLCASSSWGLAAPTSASGRSSPSTSPAAQRTTDSSHTSRR